MRYNHGADPFIGSRPIAPIDGLREDQRGAYYFGRLFDTVAARELRPLLEAGILGSSFRFKVDRERVDGAPPRSARNPERLPERTILEVTLFEIGPVTFAAYPTTTAGILSGEHPPRAVTLPPMSREEFLSRLTTDLPDTAVKREARR